MTYWYHISDNVDKNNFEEMLIARENDGWEMVGFQWFGSDLSNVFIIWKKPMENPPSQEAKAPGIEI